MSTHFVRAMHASMDSELIDLLRTVTSGFQNQMQAQVARHGAGLTAFQGRLVNLIGRANGVSQLTLASWTDRDKAQIARAVKELEARGLVTKSAHSSDWRAKCLTLTVEGKRIHSELNSLRGHLVSVALGGLTTEEKAVLRIGLDKMKVALEAATPSK